MNMKISSDFLGGLYDPKTETVAISKPKGTVILEF